MVEPFNSQRRTRTRILARNDEEPRAGAAELQSTLLLKLGFACIPTAAIDRMAEGVRGRIESGSARRQAVLTLALGSLGLVLAWTPVVLSLDLAFLARSGGLVGFLQLAVLFAGFTAFHGLLLLVTSSHRPSPRADDCFGGYLRAQREHDRWKLRIAAAMGGLVHWFVYMQVFAPLSSA